MEPQITPNSCIILKKKNKDRGIISSDLKLYYKVRVTKQYGIGIKPNTQINGTESSLEISSCIYGKLTYDKGVKNIQWRRQGPTL